MTKRKAQATGQEAEAALGSSTQPAAPHTPEQSSKRRARRLEPSGEDHPQACEIESKSRCNWGDEYSNASRPGYVQYHDTEWGVPAITDSVLFEHLVLDGAQCGLTWALILQRRAAYTRCFKHWDVAAVAEMTEEDVERLMLPEAGLIRHRAKIKSAINNAQCILRLQQRHGSFAKYLWSFMPGGRPVNNHVAALKQLPARTDKAEEISKALKAEGFKFVGPTMIYSIMQACGLVNDHLVSCFRHREVQSMTETMEWPW